MIHQLFILQGAMGVGMIIMYGGILLFIAFIIGYTSLFINIGKKKYLNIVENETQKIIIVYVLSFILGTITSAVTLALLMGVLLLFFGNTPLD